MAGTYGLSYYGAGSWGIGGGETGTFTSTSSMEVTAINNINGYGSIDATSTMVGRSISTVLSYGLGTVTSSATVYPKVTFAGYGSANPLASGSGTLTIAWDGIDDITTTWTEIEIV